MESVLNTSLTTTTTTPAPRPPPYVCNKSSSCGCGKADVSLSSLRIVGGEDAIEDSWPMIVSLRLNGTTDHSCGGTVLSSSFVLTAAHCLRSLSALAPLGLTIAAGITNRSDPAQIIRTVDRIYFHPDYNSSSTDYRHDIALLHLDQPFDFGVHARVSRSCLHRLDPSLPTNQYPANGTRLAIIGWGVLRFGTLAVPQVLQQAEIVTMDNGDDVCVSTINDVELQFCAGLYEGGKGQLSCLSLCKRASVEWECVFSVLDTCQGMSVSDSCHCDRYLSDTYRWFWWRHIPMDRWILGTSGYCIVRQRLWRRGVSRCLHSVVVLLRMDRGSATKPWSTSRTKNVTLKTAGANSSY